MTKIKTIRRVVFGPTPDEDIDAMLKENIAKIEAMRAAGPIDKHGQPVEQAAPTPATATKQLRTNLERVTLAYNDRERVLVKEIADRETELADVRRARAAASAALVELELTDLPELTVTDEAVGATP